MKANWGRENGTNNQMADLSFTPTLELEVGTWPPIMIPNDFPGTRSRGHMC